MLCSVRLHEDFFINVLFCVFVWHQVADTNVEHKDGEEQQQAHDEQQQHTSWETLHQKTERSVMTWKIHSHNSYFNTITVGLRPT